MAYTKKIILSKLREERDNEFNSLPEKVKELINSKEFEFNDIEPTAFHTMGNVTNFEKSNENLTMVILYDGCYNHERLVDFKKSEKQNVPKYLNRTYCFYMPLNIDERIKLKDYSYNHYEYDIIGKPYFITSNIKDVNYIYSKTNDGLSFYEKIRNLKRSSCCVTEYFLGIHTPIYGSVTPHYFIVQRYKVFNGDKNLCKMCYDIDRKEALIRKNDKISINEFENIYNNSFRKGVKVPFEFVKLGHTYEDKIVTSNGDRWFILKCNTCGKYFAANYNLIAENHRFKQDTCPHCLKYKNEDSKYKRILNNYYSLNEWIKAILDPSSSIRSEIDPTSEFVYNNDKIIKYCMDNNINID